MFLPNCITNFQLELDYVDVYMLHHPIMIPPDSSLAEVWKDFEKVKEDGLAKSAPS